MKAKYYVYNSATGCTKCSYDEILTATEEAERLAIQNPGWTFEIVKRIAACCSKKVHWDRIDTEEFDDLPF